MDTVNNETPKTESANTYSIISHLSPLLGYILPFANVLVPFLIMKIYGPNNTAIKENARQALNMGLSVTLSLVIALGLSLGITFSAGSLITATNAEYTQQLESIRQEMELKAESAQTTEELTALYTEGVARMQAARDARVSSSLIPYLPAVPVLVFALYGLYGVIMGILNAIRVNKSEKVSYPFSIEFVKFRA